MRIQSSRERTRKATRKRNKPYIFTALFFLGLAVLTSFLPSVYSAFPKAGGRLTALLVMLVLLIVLAVFTLRYLFIRLHGDKPERGELTQTWVVLAIEIIVMVGLSAVLSALLTGAFHVAVSEGTTMGTENLVGTALNALLFPLLVCAPMASLSVGAFGNGFWGAFGRLLKHCYLWILLCALLCFGAGLLFTTAFDGFIGAMMSAILTALLLTFGAEVCIERRLFAKHIAK